MKPIKPCIIGVDEAGRGAWAGPVVAACVMWSGKNPLKGVVKDSKKMSSKEREKTYQEILQKAEQGKLTYGVGIIGNDVIDAVGIREANRRAMEDALREIQKTKYKRQNRGSSTVILGQVNPLRSRDERDPGTLPTGRQVQENKLSQSEFINVSGLDSRSTGSTTLITRSEFVTPPLRGNDGKVRILIDGRDNYSFDIPGLPIPEYIVRGDSKIKQIMAASILAKVTRDRLMIEHEKEHAGYAFHRHKGYGTSIHQVALKKLGITQIHRKSYAPIKLATLLKGL